MAAMPKPNNPNRPEGQNDKPQKAIRLGEILIEQGVLSEQKVFEINQAQRKCRKPFGVLAEEMFDVTVHSIENAWVEQYVRQTGELNLSDVEIDGTLLDLLDRRQAWQFEMLPLFQEKSGEYVVACTRDRLARAVTFAGTHFPGVVYFRVVEKESLLAQLRKLYPMPQLSKEILNKIRTISAAHMTSAA